MKINEPLEITGYHDSVFSPSMNITKPKWLLCFDFDGTFIDPNHSTKVAPDLMNSLEELRSRGAVFAINTGRSLIEAMEGMNRCRLRGIPDYLIAWEREIYQPNQFGRWIDYGNWNKKCRKDHLKLFKRNRKFLDRIKHLVEEQSKAKWVASSDEPAAIIATSDQEMDQLCDLIQKEIIGSSPKNISYERNSIYLRFAHSNYNKGTAAASLGEMIGVPHTNTFVIGDNHNDLSMLDKEIAAMIACPANSVQSVKNKVQQQGGYIASQNSGLGVAEAISHFFN